MPESLDDATRRRRGCTLLALFHLGRRRVYQARHMVAWSAAARICIVRDFEALRESL